MNSCFSKVIREKSQAYLKSYLEKRNFQHLLLSSTEAVEEASESADSEVAADNLSLSFDSKTYLSDYTDKPHKESFKTRLPLPKVKLAGKLIKEKEIKVYFLDSSKSILVCPRGKFTTSWEICNRLGELIGLSPQVQGYFCLWVTESILELALKFNYEPFIVRKHYPETTFRFLRRPIKSSVEPVFVYRRDPFLDKYIEKGITDPCAIKLLYDECRFNVLNKYPISARDVAQLAGLDMQLIFGDWMESTYSEQFLSQRKIFELIPKFIQAKNDEKTWRSLVSEAHKKYQGKNDVLLIQKLYIQYCHQFPFYGCSFIYGRICFDAKYRESKGAINSAFGDFMRVGVNSEGIFIIDHAKNELKLHLGYYEFNWQYSDIDKLLYLEFGDLKYFKTLLIMTPQGELMEGLILSFMEMQLIRNRIARGVKENAPK
ncbi:FERM domain-containing protein 8-like isoform X2 [Zophobas morio]|uniref:FERM domain-containing protein 8-like isoform X2 n=1 Tax=Zophobas morio TaxID=2755281 RepID=UPI003082CC8D